jgi:ABC-type multidrug transport system fused ATPase/permease subunit
MAKRSSYNSNGKLDKELEKVKISKESLKETLLLFTYLKPYKTKFFLSLVFIALSAFSTMIFPLLLGKMIDAAAPGVKVDLPQSQMSDGFGGFDLKTVQWSLNTIILVLFLQLTVQMVFSFMRIYLLTEVGERSLADMRKDLYGKLISQPMSFFSEQRVGELSGGQIKRLALSCLLINEPELLVLDEPTNHLDIEMIEWLQHHLSSYSKSILLITHDRYFLDEVCIYSILVF